MNAAKIEHRWTTFLKFFSEQNEGRRTRLGIFETAGDVVNDYWIEDGLPLSGIDITVVKKLPAIEIVLGTYSHTVKDVHGLKVYYSLDGNEDGLDIIGNDGENTILRFESE